MLSAAFRKFQGLILLQHTTHNPLRNKAFIDIPQMNTVKFNKKNKALKRS